MGEPWMMFTKDQGQELIDNTIYEWTSIDGVNGGKFTSKTDSSKYIFLPAGGTWWYGSESGSTHPYVGSEGIYWSTKYILYQTSKRNYALRYSIVDPHYSTEGVSCGNSIRPVRPLEW